MPSALHAFWCDQTWEGVIINSILQMWKLSLVSKVTQHVGAKAEFKLRSIRFRSPNSIPQAILVLLWKHKDFGAELLPCVHQPCSRGPWNLCPCGQQAGSLPPPHGIYQPQCSPATSTCSLSSSCSCPWTHPSFPHGSDCVLESCVQADIQGLK